MSREGGTPWPAWAAVTILVALIGAFGKSFADRLNGSPQAPASAPAPVTHVGSAPQLHLTDKLGLYVGVSVNRLVYSTGTTTLDLKAVEASGRVRAAIEWSNGLSGVGSLTGTVAGTAVELSGTVLSAVTGIWDCDVRLTFPAPDSVHGTYRLYPQPGNASGTQDGEFGLRRRQ